MMRKAWQPTASIESLQQRALILQKIRRFFAYAEVLEVETPCLSSHTITDPYLVAMHTLHTEPGAHTSSRLYLQTSPEYAMKRLLAAGSGDIFQISKAFRDDEVGHIHNPEFTMLEWYRVGYTMGQLIDETAALLTLILPIGKVDKACYASLFEKYLRINPLEADLPNLFAVCKSFGLEDYAVSLQANIRKHERADANAPVASTINESAQTFDSAAVRQDTSANTLLKDSLLQVLFSAHIEPHIGQVNPIVVHDFPASQASLATLHNNGKTANRFEVYYKGIELANGFEELTDAQSQLARFEQDNLKRSALGLPTSPIDTHFIAALNAGLPPCAGIALGIDRLLMLALQKNTIEEVMSFSHRNC